MVSVDDTRRTRTAPVALRMSLRHGPVHRCLSAVILVVMGVCCSVSKSQHTTSTREYLMLGFGASANATTPSVLLGLHNPPGAPANLTEAVNAWIHRGAPLASSPQAVTTVQMVDCYLFSSSATAAAATLQQTKLMLEQVWDMGAIPFLTVFPSFDPQQDPQPFNALNTFASESGGARNGYNEVLLSGGLPTAATDVAECASALFRQVLFPYLLPLWAAENATTPITAKQQSDLLDSSRRLYLAFAPSFNAGRFPWGASYQSPDTAVNVSNSATSYRALWSAFAEAAVVPLELFLRTELNALSAGQSPSVITDSFLQVVWTVSAVPSSLLSNNSSPNARMLAEWLPDWECTVCEQAQCGPQWFVADAVDTRLTPGKGGSAAISPMLNALLDIGAQIGDRGRRSWCRAAVVANTSIPVGLASVGRSAIIGPAEKDAWVTGAVQYAIQSGMVQMVVLENRAWYASTLSTVPPVEWRLEVLSFDDSGCCDAFDPTLGTSYLDSLGQLLSASVDRFVASASAAGGAAAWSSGSCFQCRVVDDATFAGVAAMGSGTAPTMCSCPIHGSSEKWWIRDFTNPVVLCCVGLLVISIVGILLWRKRHIAAQRVRQRMILGRYMVTRVLQPCRHVSSVLVAYDATQRLEVVIKQYVLTTDSATALANNEIEKYRACVGFPHIVQLVQCTFAWKNLAAGADAASSDFVRVGADSTDELRYRLLSDPSSSGLVNSSATSTGRSSGTNAANTLVMNATNATRVPFAIVVMKKYSSGDLKRFVDAQKHATQATSDAHTGVSATHLISLITQLCLALNSLHTLVHPGDPLLHRDVKPENVFLERRPLRAKPTEFVYLAYLGDFGCAVFQSQLRAAPAAPAPAESLRVVTSPLAPLSPSGSSTATKRTFTDPFLTSRAVGTSRFMAPEARQGSYSPACDMWSLGCTALYTMLREVPDDYCLALQHDSFVKSARQTLLRSALCPPWLVDLIFARLLAYDAEKRCSAADALREIKCGVTPSPSIDAALKRRPIDEVFGEPTPTADEVVDDKARGEVVHQLPQRPAGEHEGSEGGDELTINRDDLLLDDDEIVEISEVALREQ